MKKAKKIAPTEAYEEAISLYHAWLGVLLRHMGQGELRVKAQEISQGLGSLSCEVSREGDEYVIRLTGKVEADFETPMRGEDVHGGEEEYVS